MNCYIKYKHLVLGVGLVFVCFVANTQNLLNSNTGSIYTYIYKLSDIDAEEIIRNGNIKPDRKYLNNLIDSFHVDSQYVKKLDQGYYLYAGILNNYQFFKLENVHDFKVFIFNNYNDLIVKVFDKNGDIIPDARLSVNDKSLLYDEETQSFVDKTSNKKGLLKVKVNGYTAFYNLERRKNSPGFVRSTKSFLFNTPVKYIWKPIRFICRLPYDGIKSLVLGNRYMTINWLYYYYVDFSNNIRCFFNSDDCEEYKKELKFKKEYNGFMVLNKPKYHQRDTVRLKAFIVHTNGKPINEKIQLELTDGNLTKKLGSISPYRPGGYECQIVLHDSLRLKQNSRYQILLKLEKDYEVFLEESFQYENYDLSGISLNIRDDNQAHYKGKKYPIFVKATDENDLNLQDASVKIFIEPDDVIKCNENHVFVPDTIYTATYTLKPTNETEIVIPDSVFPRADLTYSLTIYLNTADNRILMKEKRINYYDESLLLNMSFEDDSIRFESVSNGIRLGKQSTVFGEDGFGNKEIVHQGVTPFVLKINPLYSFYTIQSGDYFNTVNVNNESSLLSVESVIRNDSLFISVNNPRNLQFVYHVFKGQKIILSGCSQQLDLKQKAYKGDVYLFSIQYLWAGQETNDIWEIQRDEHTLFLNINQPKIVFPGMKTRIEVEVKDIWGKPVEGADVTAYSLTKKFNYTPTTIEWRRKIKLFWHFGNSFSLKNPVSALSNQIMLDDDFILNPALIDTIEYYKFLYPGDEIYNYRYFTKDSITQFAPFVTSKGAIIPIHVVYVDNIPVYFSWATYKRPYSFHVDKGFHQIKIRTEKNVFTVDSVLFNEKEKLIFSFDKDYQHQNIEVESADSLLSENEMQYLSKYQLGTTMMFYGMFQYLENEDDVFVLEDTGGVYSKRVLIGPVSGLVHLYSDSSYLYPINIEPYYDYYFYGNYYKMKDNGNNGMPMDLSKVKTSYSLNDELLSKKRIINNNFKKLQTSVSDLNVNTIPKQNKQFNGAIKLKIDYEDPKVKKLLRFILLFKVDDAGFIRVYDYNDNYFDNLEKGTYRILLMYEKNRYLVMDSLNVGSWGVDYYSVKPDSLIKEDDFSIKINSLLNTYNYRGSFTNYQFNYVFMQLLKLHNDKFGYFEKGKIIEGHVYAAHTKKPIKDAIVKARYTYHGSITDENGYYKAFVPSQAQTIVFCAENFISLEIACDSANQKDVYITKNPTMMPVVCVYALHTPLISADQTQTGGVATGAGVMHNNAYGVEALLLNVDSTGIFPIAGGQYVFKLPGYQNEHFNSYPLVIINGFVYHGDLEELDTSIVKEIHVLRGAEAVDKYGDAGAGGVILIETLPGYFVNALADSNKGADFDQDFYEEAMKSSAVRNYFSDYAFWQPKLKTDKFGKAVFEVVFPDDITKWETYYIAINDKNQLGQAKSSIKSYKPLLAKVLAPKALVVGDTAYALGQIINYSNKVENVYSQYVIDNNPSVEFPQRACVNSLVDTLSMVAVNDTLKLKYLLKNDNGYFDGEQSDIPVFKKGMPETKGRFLVLESDTSFRLASLGLDTNLTIVAQASKFDIIQNEIRDIDNYKYLCNEQLASKVKALLALSLLQKSNGTAFDDKQKIENLIRQLNKNKNSDGLWGWWGNSNDNYWISLHVIEALIQAEQMGYQVSLNRKAIADRLISYLDFTDDHNSKLNILLILKTIDAVAPYEKKLNEIEKKNKLTFPTWLKLCEIKQKCGMPIDMDSIMNHKETTFFGNVFFKGTKDNSYLFENEVYYTLQVYKILKNDTLDHSIMLRKMRNYFFEKREKGTWGNTYHSSQIIETILPDLISENVTQGETVLEISGVEGGIYKKFPLEVQINSGKDLIIRKTGNMPVYFSVFQKLWNEAPIGMGDDFEISTSFDDEESTILPLGQEVSLFVYVNVKKDAEYVMISVPIPGGCSYPNQSNDRGYETHRVKDNHETTIFYENMPRGKYRFEIRLIPRFKGVYTLNPAKVELMYFPVFYSNSELKQVIIK